MRARQLAHLLVHRLSLLADHHREVRVGHLRGQCALHYGATVVLLDVPHPLLPLHHDVLGEPLLLEVANGVVVGEGDEVGHVLLLAHVLLEVIHQASAIAFHLLAGAHRAEGDLGHFLAPERAVSDAANHLAVLEADHGVVVGVEHQADDVLLGHVGQLLAEDILQRDEPHEVLFLPVVLDDHVHELAVVLLLTQVNLPHGVLTQVLRLAADARPARARPSVRVSRVVSARAGAGGARLAAFGVAILALHPLSVGLPVGAVRRRGSVAPEERPHRAEDAHLRRRFDRRARPQTKSAPRPANEVDGGRADSTRRRAALDGSRAFAARSAHRPARPSRQNSAGPGCEASRAV